MDIFQVLKKDHQKAKELLTQLVAASDEAVSTRAKIFLELKNDLTAHTKVEEKLFYSKLKQDPEDEEIIEHAIEEHGEIDRLLSEMEKIPKDNAEWDERLVTLKGNVERHIEEEEGEIFEEARKIFGKRELEELGDRFEKEENQEKGIIV